MGLEEATVLVLDRLVEAPEVAAVLVGWGFVGLVDDAEGHPVNQRRLDAEHVPQSKIHRFEHSLLAAVAARAELKARPEIELGPADRVRLSQIVLEPHLLAL